MRVVITEDSDQERPLWQKLAWFAALWGLGVGTVGAVAYVLKLWID